jgi:hypothetical protein
MPWERIANTNTQYLIELVTMATLQPNCTYVGLALGDAFTSRLVNNLFTLWVSYLVWMNIRSENRHQAESDSRDVLFFCG